MGRSPLESARLGRRRRLSRAVCAGQVGRGPPRAPARRARRPPRPALRLTRDELRYILDPTDVYGPDFPGETFRVLKEKEERALGEYPTRRLVLEAWDRLEAGLGPVVVRNYREEMNGGQETGDRRQGTGVRGQRLTESGPTYQVSGPPATPAPPKFGAYLVTAPAVKPAPAAEPEAPRRSARPVR